MVESGVDLLFVCIFDVLKKVCGVVVLRFDDLWFGCGC